jgi:hypothetical protein
MSDQAKEWKNIAIRLSSCLHRHTLDCYELHHNKGEYHDGNTPCPVVTMILKVNEDFDKLLASTKRNNKTKL